ncbi:MAG: putative Ig domain-containing protein [Vicinamibacterales bacterium]
MRRALWVLALAAVAVLPLAAQQPVFSPRWAGRLLVPDEGGSTAQIAIIAPTTAQTWQQSAATLELRGTAASAASLVSIDWTNDQGGSGSVVGPLDAWTIPVAGSATKFSDAFDGSANGDVVSHTPAPLGTAHVEVEDTAGDNYFELRASQDYVQPLANNTSGSARIINGVTYSGTLTGAHARIGLTLKGAGGTDDGFGWGHGRADTQNYCGVYLLGPNANPDAFLFKLQANAVTILAQANLGLTIDDVLALEYDGPDMDLLADGVSTGLTASDGFCDNAEGFWYGAGALTRVSGDDISTAWRFDDLIIEDLDASGGGITLAEGVNVLEVCVTDSEAGEACDTLTVTRTAGDVTDPTIAITSPNAGAPFQTSSASVSLGGVAADETSLSSVSCGCPTCTPTSAAGTPAAAWSSGPFTLAEGANTFTCTATDASANTGTDTQVITYIADDSEAPSVAITAPADPHTATAAPLLISGTSSDNVGVTLVSWVNSAGGSGSATGLNSWSFSAPLSVGEQTFTVTARDEAGNTATDTLTVTYEPALQITTSAVSPFSQNVGGQTRTIAAQYGTPPYSFDITAGTLPTGLSLATTGVISGTCTTVESGSVTFRVTDDVSDTATKALTVACVDPSAEAAHDFFEEMIARGDCYRAYSFRPDPMDNTWSFTDCSAPYYAQQLTRRTATGGGLLTTVPDSGMLTYDPVGDTHPEKQDAMKVWIDPLIPLVQSGQQVTITEAIDDTQTTMTLSHLGNSWGDEIQIDNEVMILVRVSGQPLTNPVTVVRGVAGTTAASHDAGAAISINNNNLSPQAYAPIDTTDGHTYLVSWDVRTTSDYLRIADGGLDAYKWFNFRSSLPPNPGKQPKDKIWFEPKAYWDGSPGGDVCGFDLDTHVGVVNFRIYASGGFNGPADWTLSSPAGDQAGPGTSVDEPLIRNGDNGTSGAPTFGAAQFCMYPGRWTRFFALFDQRANDYDPISVWVNDELQDTVQVLDELPWSVYTGTNSIQFFQVEYNTSNGGLQSNFPDGLTSYVRNLVVLEDPSPEDIATIIQRKPVAD